MLDFQPESLYFCSRPMMPQKIRGLEKILGRPFRKKSLLLAALTHPSHLSESTFLLSPERFQRVEFLGDAILNFFIATKLYQLFPKADEGLLSRLRSILVSRKLLACIARAIHLDRYLILGELDQKNSDLPREKMLADALEALIAVIYFDSSMRTVERFLFKCFKPHFNQRKLFRFDPNPKSALQEYTQKNFATLPVYRSRHEKEDRTFVAWVTVRGHLKTEAKGRSRREAESKAASKLLKKLRAKKKSLSSTKTDPED